jgi:hypothetical protein
MVCSPSPQLASGYRGNFSFALSIFWALPAAADDPRA